MNKNNRLLKTLVFILIGFDAVLISLNVIKVNYDVIVPASTNPIEKVYTIDNDQSYIPNIYSVSVISKYNVSLADYLVSKINPYAIVSEHSKYENSGKEYLRSSGLIQKELSLKSALIASFKEASKTCESITYSAKFKGYTIYALYGNLNTPFKIGDTIISCEGVRLLPEFSYLDAVASLYGTRNLDYDKEYHFEVLRSGAIQEISVHPYKVVYADGSSGATFGLSVQDDYDLDEASFNPHYEITMPDSLGPSAGLMQALYIYDLLSGQDLTNGHKICGTGMIYASGATGAIGGVEAKIVAATLAKCDIFFVPSSNYDAAKESLDHIKSKMELVKVDSLVDVINYLLTLKETSHE